jgi:phosphate transport system substrate-binding protein
MSTKSHKQLHNVALVDKVWNLKRECELKLKIHIPLNMVLKDEEYRAELLESALSLNDDNLTRLVWEIREMEDNCLGSQARDDQLDVKRKSKKNIKLNYIAATACAVLIFLSGYLLRSFLPLDAGQVFVLQAIANTQIKSAVNVNKQPVSQHSNSVPVKSAAPLFRLHGSNTLGEKLAPRLVEAYLMGKGAINVKSEKGNNPVEKTVSGEINGHIEFIEIHAHGSSTAFTDMLDGKTDVGMSSRRIKEQEQQSLIEKYGDLTLPSSENIIGLDGLAIITHPTNPVEALSIMQLVKIFSGEITNWEELGGKNAPIVLYARDEKSGTWDTFKSIVLEPSKSTLSTTAMRLESSSELSDAVAKEQGAIGFIGLPYVRRAKLMRISVTKNSLAILPTHFTVSTEDYPLSRRLYFYLPQNHSNTDAEDFVKFSETERGQSIVEDIGLVSQNIKTGLPFDHSFYPVEMRELTSRSQRLSLNFRFKDGSDELDTKALSDLDRLVKYVEMNYPQRLQLFGFSDGEGDKQQNQELSLRRARVVEEHLIARGIYPLIAKGMGEEAPLASSKTESGRRINRRVEVWIL